MRDPRDDKSLHSISFSKVLIFDLLMAIFSFFWRFFLLFVGFFFAFWGGPLQFDGLVNFESACRSNQTA